MVVDKKEIYRYVGPMDKYSWQWRLFSISLMKKEKVRILQNKLDLSGHLVLDIGCAQGVVSAALKEGNGRCLHLDPDFANLLVARPVLGAELMQSSGAPLPFGDNGFACVLLLDILEHVDDDLGLLREAVRVLRPGGKLVISTPISGGFFFFHRLKKRLGLTPEIYGHKREGYSLSDLDALMKKSGLEPEYRGTYAKFFVEMVELMLNVLFIKKNRIKTSTLSSGAISPTSESSLDKNPVLMSIYRYFAYPILYLFTRLDRLLFWKTGYATLVIARKE